MNIEALHAFVIHKRLIGDTSAYVTFFTKEKGIITCNCRGARTPKKQAILQAFTPLWITLDRKVKYAQQIEAYSLAIPLKQDALFAGLYINELIFHTLKPGDLSEETINQLSINTPSIPHNIYESYLLTLKMLNSSSSKIAIAAILRKFEMNLLITTGYEPSLSHDVNNIPIDHETLYNFIAGEGFFAINNFDKSSTNFRLNHIINNIPGEHILCLKNQNIEEIQNLEILNSAKLILRATLDLALAGRKIKTRTLYTKI